MKSVVNVAIVGLFAFALQANAQQAASVISAQTMQRLQQTEAARNFLANKLGVRSSSVTDANAALSKLSAGERAAVLKAINSYNTQFSANNSAANEALAKKAFDTNTGSDVLKVAAAAQGSASKSAVTDTATNVTCGTKVTGIEMAVEGGPSAADLDAAIAAGNLGDHNCEEPLRALTIQQKIKAGNIAVCMTKKGVGVNDSAVVKLNKSVECFEESGFSAEDAKSAAYAIAGVTKKDGCGWFTGRLVTAQEAGVAAH